MIAGMKRPRYQLLLGISLPRLLMLALLVLCFFSGTLSSRIVTLGSIQIFNTHEILRSKPSVYFRCKGENKTSLPDVEKTNFLYTFKGEESWQPLTELPDKKCKRCGLYEADDLTPDDVFDEWELCPEDFVDGEYMHFKEKEMNATFVCLQCTSSDSSGETSGSLGKASRKESKTTLVVIICLLASVVAVVGLVVGFKYWQKRKREHDQARFLKLFEEGDDIEDELGLGKELETWTYVNNTRLWKKIKLHERIIDSCEEAEDQDWRISWSLGHKSETPQTWRIVCGCMSFECAHIFDSWCHVCAYCSKYTHEEHFGLHACKR